MAKMELQKYKSCINTIKIKTKQSNSYLIYDIILTKSKIMQFATAVPLLFIFCMPLILLINEIIPHIYNPEQTSLNE